MKNCPLCAQIMRINDYKDYVCKCQGPLLCFPALTEISKRNLKMPLGEITVIITDGANDVERCNVLYRLGVKWNAQRQLFYMTWSSRNEANDFIAFLEKHNFSYSIES